MPKLCSPVVESLHEILVFRSNGLSFVFLFRTIVSKKNVPVNESLIFCLVFHLCPPPIGARFLSDGGIGWCSVTVAVAEEQHK